VYVYYVIYAKDVIIFVDISSCTFRSFKDNSSNINNNLLIFEPRHDKTNIVRSIDIHVRIHTVRLQTLLQVEKLIANSMDPNQTVQMRKLVWIHAGRKPTMLVLS
jgi:hypothetical protein